MNQFMLCLIDESILQITIFFRAVNFKIFSQEPKSKLNSNNSLAKNIE